MERNIQKIGLSNLVALLLIGAASSGVVVYSNSLSGGVALAFMGLGFVVSVVSYIQIRLEQREALEELELQEMAKSARDSSLFTSTDSEVFPARRAREQFERYALPVFSILLLILQGVGAWLLWSWLDRPVLPSVERPLLTIALLALFALILFLMGKYSAGIARLEKQRLLRPSASYLLLIAYILFVVVASLAAVHADNDFRKVDLFAGRALVVLLGLTAFENLLNLVLEIYRPRTRSGAERVIYESRLVGFLAQPQGIITTVSQALDYQFGFKVSETWFYRFLERSLGWLILAQVALLFISSCFVFVDPTEEALLERFGRPVQGRALLSPGAHVKLPWPIDKVRRFDTTKVQTFNIGLPEDAHIHGGEEQQHSETVLWTDPHHQDAMNMLVASRKLKTEGESDTEGREQRVPPVNVANVNIPVQFQITNLVQWAYRYTDSMQVLQNTASDEVVSYLANEDFLELMATGKGPASDELKQRIQDAANGRRLGVDLIHVGLQNIHPPAEVASTFQKYMGAIQDKEAARLRAEGDALYTNAVTRANATKIVQEARSYQARTTKEAEAAANQFTNRLAAFQASPEVFGQRAYLRSLGRGIEKSKKVILGATNNSQVINLNLEEKLRPDLLDVPVQEQ